MRLSAVALIGAGVAVGTAGQALAATTSGGGYGPPPVTNPSPPGGFSNVVTTVTICQNGGAIGPDPVDQSQLTVFVPAGAFPTCVQITVTAPDLADITPMHDFTDVTGAGIQVTRNGAPYSGTFLKPVTATFRSSRISADSDVLVWNGSAFVTDPDSTDAQGDDSVSFNTDPDFTVEDQDTGTLTKVPGATVPVTGKPLLGEGILAGALLLAGAGGVVASRRRRATTR
ncbi:MAG TPA: hypothetical protein VHZ33_16230 [Trebonia sp.]|nr:hypothetical protein [Trebonia sp.]